MKTDVNGCSSCKNGQENYEAMYNKILKRDFIQYDYRHTNGELFSCVGKSLEHCQTKRNNWLKEQ